VEENVVGHVPREISKPIFYFIKNNGEVQGVISGKRQYSATPGKGLEVPCVYEFNSDAKKLTILKKLLRKAGCTC
jgi:hypothetical protein